MSDIPAPYIHQEACPRCGSAPSPKCAKSPPGQFLCGTIVNSDGVLQSDGCRLAEVMIQRDQAQLAAGRNQSRADQCDMWQIEATERLKQIHELSEQLREQSKSYCTHCMKMFPGGKEGVAAFREHIAECHKHPLNKLAIEKRNWREYALALQRLYDNGGPLIEPALAREVEELRERCHDR